MSMLLYESFQNYWELYHKVTFDGLNKLILINQDETDIDIQRDVYSAWKEWVQVEYNSKWLQALSIIGGEPTVAGQQLDATYFLVNGWKIKPWSGSYTLDLEGNIFDIDGEEIIIPADTTPGVLNNININTNTSAIVRRVDSGSDTQDLEQLKYGDTVYIDTVNGGVGSEYPVGTLALPVDNMNDAVNIAVKYGIRNFSVRGNLIVDRPVRSYNFFAGEYNPIITFQDEITVNKCKFTGFQTVGTVFVDNGQEVFFENCNIGDLDGFNGTINNSYFNGGTLTLSENQVDRKLIINDSIASSENSYPIIALPGLSASLGTQSNIISVKNFNGGIGLTGTFATGSTASFDINSGIVYLLDGIEGGSITIRGMGQLYNETTNTNINIDTSGFSYDVENSNFRSNYKDQIVIDPVNGLSGSDYPFGTRTNPVSNINDALLIAQKYKINTLEVINPATFSNVDISDYIVQSSVYPVDLHLDNVTASNTKFDQITLGGTFSSSSSILINGSNINDLDNFQGIIKNSLIGGAIGLGDSSQVTIANSASLNPDETDSLPSVYKYNGLTSSVSFSLRSYSGDFTLKDWNNVGDVATMEFQAGRANIDPTSSEGTIVIRGIGTLNDQTGTASNLMLITNGFQSDINDHLERMEPELFRIGGVIDDASDRIVDIDASIASTSSQVYDLLQSVAGTVSLIYQDTTEIVADVDYLVGRIDTQSDILNQIAGLVQKNYRIFNQVYDGDLLTNATIRTFPTATDADNNTNAQYEYSMTAVYDGDGKLIDYKVVQN